MNKIILAFWLMITTISFGQNCKYKVNEIDEFTKNKILETKKEYLGVSFGFSTSFSFKKINDKRYLLLGIGSNSIFTLKNGEAIMLKTNAETPITLTFTETTIAKGQYNNMLNMTIWGEQTLIPIDENSYQRIKNETVLKIRVYTGDGYIDDDVNEKRSFKFQELAKCIE